MFKSKHSTRRVMTLGILVAAAATSIVAINPAPAAAVSFQNSGCPGSYGVMPTYGDGGSVISQLFFPAHRVWRSRCYAGATQLITVTLLTYTWTPHYDSAVRAWFKVPSMSQTITYRVPPGYHVDVPQFAPMASFEGGDDVGSNFSTREVVSWRTAGGVLIGWTTTDHDGPTILDYACSQASTGGSCTIQMLGGRGSLQLWPY